PPRTPERRSPRIAMMAANRVPVMAPGADAAPGAGAVQRPSTGSCSRSCYCLAALALLIAIIAQCNARILYEYSPQPTTLCAKEDIPTLVTYGIELKRFIPELPSLHVPPLMPCSNAETYNRALLSDILRWANVGEWWNTTQLTHGELRGLSSEDTFAMALIHYARALARIPDHEEKMTDKKMLEIFGPYLNRIRCSKFVEMPKEDEPFQFPMLLCMEGEMDGEVTEENKKYLFWNVQARLMFFAFAYGEYKDTAFAYAREASDESNKNLISPLETSLSETT
ncbi:hypothetical protein PFISCL1PPCAC_17669, partial [Pristionchus fissidentatus]